MQRRKWTGKKESLLRCVNMHPGSSVLTLAKLAGISNTWCQQILYQLKGLSLAYYSLSGARKTQVWFPGKKPTNISEGRLFAHQRLTAS